MLRRIFFMLCLLVLTLASTTVSAAPKKPTAKQLTALTEVARAERAGPGLTVKQRTQLKQLVAFMKAGDVAGARRVWSKLRNHPRAAHLLDHALFHAFVVPKPRLAKVARKYRFYRDQEERVRGYLRLLRRIRRQAGTTTITIPQRDFTTYTAGGEVEVHKGTKKLKLAKLEDVIKELESMQERVRNKRQEQQTMFENFDQKKNQLFNILSTVLKSMKEMQSSVTRNFL